MITALKVFLGILLVLAALLVGFIALTWAPERSVADLQRRWAPPPSTFVELLGMSVHLRDEGPREDPTPIVLIHGFGSSLHAWEGWVSALKDSRRVVTFDLQGFGLTGPSPDNVYGREADLRFLTALLDKLGLQKVVLGGNSLGAGLSLRFALAQPHRVERLVLVDGGYAIRAESEPIGFRLLNLPGVPWLLSHSLPRFLVKQGMADVWGDPSRITEEMIDRAYELTQREGNRGALIARSQQRRAGSASDRLSEIKVPTLIMWGGRDRLVPLEAARRLHAGIGGSTLVVFDDLGHAPEEEDAQRTVQAFKTFLAH